MLVIANDLQHNNTLTELLLENCNLSAKGIYNYSVIVVAVVLYFVYNVTRLVNASALLCRYPRPPCLLSHTFSDLAYVAIHTYPVYCSYLPSHIW